MRNAFAAALTTRAESDRRVVMLSGDIGNKLFDNFKRVAPERFFNCGVAEANLISVGAGMAMCGLRPVAYTITSFITYRCYEQIRVDLCYHQQPVVVVGVGSGLGYASLGATHHTLEDIAIMRALPHMTVFCPADPREVPAALDTALALTGPSYIRLGKKGEETVHSAMPSIVPGKAIVMRPPGNVVILSTGTILPLALRIADELASNKLSVGVVHFPTVKPLDLECLRAVGASTRLLVSLEEHSRIGGFGSAVAEWHADEAISTRLLRCGTHDDFLHTAGEEEYARHKMGIGREAVLSQIRVTLAKQERNL